MAPYSQHVGRSVWACCHFINAATLKRIDKRTFYMLCNSRIICRLLFSVSYLCAFRCLYGPWSSGDIGSHDLLSLISEMHLVGDHVHMIQLNTSISTIWYDIPLQNMYIHVLSDRCLHPFCGDHYCSGGLTQLGWLHMWFICIYAHNMHNRQLWPVVYGKNQDTEFSMCFILLPKYGMMQHASDDLIEEVSCTNIARTHGHVIYVIHVPLHQDTFHLT